MLEDGKTVISRRKLIQAAGLMVAAAGILGEGAGSVAAVGTGSESSVTKASQGGARSILPKGASRTRRDIQEFVDQIPIVSTHEHLRAEKAILAGFPEPLDFSQILYTYNPADLISSGLPKETWDKVRGSDMPIDEKWKIIEPYWEKSKYTGYGWAIDITIRNYYGLDGLSSNTYRELDKRMRAERRPGIYSRMLKDAAGIECGVSNLKDEWSDELAGQKFLHPSRLIDQYVFLWSADDLRRLSERTKRDLGTPEAVRAMFDDIIGGWKRTGTVAAKCYARNDMNYVPDKDRQRVLDAASKQVDEAGRKSLQDFMFNQVVKACIDHKMPIQVHTGLNSGNNYPSLKPRDPMLLWDICYNYPEARFDVFHAGYPWMREVAVLARVNTSAYADLCWEHVVNPAAARAALDEWLDSMPASKIFAFGGDYWQPEGTYGHAAIARTNVGEALADRVERGRMSMKDAKQVAAMILHDNAKGFFGIS
ncbi:MAG: amidohydrolase family protein [Armatimonadetes bacterium]|nr:amidohydrolase family protein [Armatimonadota bacterium]